MVCEQNAKKWWKVVTKNTHELISEEKCIEEQPDIYVELIDGSIVEINTILPPTTNWNWDLLPKELIQELKELSENFDVKGATKIINKHYIAGYIICCDTTMVLPQVRNAIKNNYI